MKIDDERDLRERLEAVFEAMSPHPAPVDDAIRGGRVIKRRRRMALAVGAGVVAVAGAVTVPSLVHQTASPAPAAPVKSYTVTVQAPGPGAQPGLISSGTINGQRWSISADRPGADAMPFSLSGVRAVGGHDGGRYSCCLPAGES